MKIIKSIVITAVSSLPLLPQAALSDTGLDYALGLEAGIRNTEFEFDAEATSFPNSSSHVEFEELLYIVGFSGSLIYDQFYLTGLIELTPQAADTDVEVSSVFKDESGLPDQSTDRSSDVDKIDFSLTFGYQVWDGLSVFSGYKYSEFKLYGNEYNFLLNNKDQKYSEEGLFIGSSYAWHFGPKGSLSLSVAYAFLEADYSEDNIDLTDTPPIGTLNFGEVAFDGSSQGLSFGAQWSGPLVDAWMYKVGVKYQSYKSENNSTTVDAYLTPEAPLPPVNLSDIDTKHTDTIFTVGIAYVFQ